MSHGALLKESIVRGHAMQAKRVANEWADMTGTDLPKAIYCVVDGCLELAHISESITIEAVQGEVEPFLEQLPEWVREKNKGDLASYAFSNVGGKQGKRAVNYWERFWIMGLGSALSVADVIDRKLPQQLERWMLPLSQSPIRHLRHVATVAVLSIAQALGHHLRNATKELDTIRRQMEGVGAGKTTAIAKLESEIKVLEERIKILSTHRQTIVETTIPYRSRDLDEQIRLYSLSEVDRMIKQEPAMFLTQKWTARIFLMIHDQNAEVRLKALSSIGAWFERMRHHAEEVKEHLYQFAERCMLHMVDRIHDVDSRVACKAIQILRLPVLAERMTDEEVEKVANLVSAGTDSEVRQEAALFVNSQIFQDPGICMPERKGIKRRRGGLHAGRDREGDDGMSELSDAGDLDDEEAIERETPDNIATLLNSETSISMFIEYLENYMGQSLRLTDRAVNAFWQKAPCLSHWHTMVSLMILGESNKAPGSDPVSNRQRLILLHVMEAAIRRATEDVKKAGLSGVREKGETKKMDEACAKILPELPRIFELCHPEEKQVLIVSHICKMLIDHAESRNMKEVIWNARSLAKVLKQCILDRGYMDVVKHATDSMLVMSVFVAEVRTQFIDVAKQVNADTMKCVQEMLDGTKATSPEDLRSLIGKFDVINQRGIDMSFGNHDCLTAFLNLLKVRVENMRKCKAHREEHGEEAEGFKFADNMPDTGNTIYLIENSMIVTSWYFRFCHWEHQSPASEQVQQLDALQEKRIKETREMLPKAFMSLREVMCALMEVDRSPHVKHMCFSSYM
jgi:hypothetical protein